ncbi:hypothetical protein SKAU_G00001550 [Synaphobranchus kaupii]|uniref:Uncharacterized protein n=1 Tax=Synaphobranchus kaupii TaxID=118154 RepID=A0A9Q1JCH1_SYNKA|nr:hypothetical protein SKAU_G00001550 [Synaphobranchus kaupii]
MSPTVHDPPDRQPSVPLEFWEMSRSDRTAPSLPDFEKGAIRHKTGFVFTINCCTNLDGPYRLHRHPSAILPFPARGSDKRRLVTRYRIPDDLQVRREGERSRVISRDKGGKLRRSSLRGLPSTRALPRCRRTAGLRALTEAHCYALT